MNSNIVEDAREYIVPLFAVEAQGEGVLMESRKFLGTAFFVTRQGDAITAAHVLPSPTDLGEKQRLVAVVSVGGNETVCWVNRAAVFGSFDVALLKINLTNTHYLPVSDASIHAGTDIQVVGIPNHEVVGAGKEMRILKGHVTFVHKHLELNFPIPAGMSGSPVLVGKTVIGCATGRVRTEEIEDQYEEIVKVTNTREEIHIITTARVTYYGLALPFSKLATVRDPMLENRTLLEFISAQNNLP